MTRIGTPLSPTATRVLLCGCGELGKEVVIELQRLGVEVIAVDRYANAPAMQVAHRSHVINMLDGAALRAVIETEKPHYIVPEIEAIATATLVELESEGFTVIPTARAAQLTMNLAVPLRRHLPGLQPGRAGPRLSLCSQAGHEFLGQGPEPAALAGRCAGGMGLCSGRRARRKGPRDH
jgi:NAD dependent epimerase/dehydratase family